jgi:hypothetical protein
MGDLETFITLTLALFAIDVTGKWTYPEGSQCLQPPYERHLGRSRPAPLPQCSLERSIQHRPYDHGQTMAEAGH